MRLTLGAPNIYRAPDEMRRTLGNVRMDVCAFVGVAPRGPARVPIEPENCEVPRAYVEPERARARSLAVPVESWDDYKRLYGAFEGPGRLAYAVATFFEQGGRRAYITRIVHEYGNTAANLNAVASGTVNNVASGVGDIVLEAKNEGGWGNKLRAALGFDVTPVELLAGSSISELVVGIGEQYPAGSLLRLSIPQAGGQVNTELRFVSHVRIEGTLVTQATERYLTLDVPVAEPPVEAEILTGNLVIDDGAGVIERFTELGLSHRHPNWVATVLYRDSELVNPVHTWVDSDMQPDAPLQAPLDPRQVLLSAPVLFSGGEDRYRLIEHADFFDDTWVLGNPGPGDGIQAHTHLNDLSSLVVPDLYVPEAIPEVDGDESVDSLAGAVFAPCDDFEPAQVDIVAGEHSLNGLLLNPLNNTDLKEIIRLQKKIVDFCGKLCQFVALLDVPPGLSQKKIISWRANFRSSYAAAYHPWLKISNLDDRRDNLIRINPAATAAGIIAQQEINFGVPQGPANTIANGAVKVDEKVSLRDHDQLHPLGVNVYMQERDGVRLTAGRTLSRDKRYRQLSVRRLMLMLRRALQQQMHWMVFEPNNASLWADVRHMLDSYLRQLYIAGAFKGRTEEEAFFVRCDGELNHRRVVDAGRLICEIGVAPVEPLEFIVVRITRGGDGTLAVES